MKLVSEHSKGSPKVLLGPLVAVLTVSKLQRKGTLHLIGDYPLVLFTQYYTRSFTSVMYISLYLVSSSEPSFDVTNFAL